MTTANEVSTDRWFRAARAACGLRIADAALKLGVTELTVRTWENGSRTPHLFRAKVIAKVYGLDVEDVIRRLDPPN